MANAFLYLNGVQKKMKQQTVIRDFNLEAERGQIIALCGGNGAGKSTVLRMLAGILQPDAGEITVGGLTWRKDRRAYAELIGYMPDDYQFVPGLTAMETMLFWAKMRGITKDRAAESLASVGLSDTGRKSVSSFSKGMRQRVLFAQVLLASPPLILMDEPTNGLDAHWLDSFIRLVKEAAKNNQTVLFSTHQHDVAEALADRIVYLKDGVVVK